MRHHESEQFGVIFVGLLMFRGGIKGFSTRETARETRQAGISVDIGLEAGKMSSCEKRTAVVSVPEVSDSQPGPRHERTNVD